MTLGDKLRQQRQQAGLSQKQLCGSRITRNMLSQIENGSASPSLDTLRYLAEKLGKPVGFFLDEPGLISENQQVMLLARAYYDGKKWEKVAETLQEYQRPDPVYDREAALLDALCRLNWAQELLQAGRKPYARAILQEIQTQGLYMEEQLEYQRLLLLGQVESVELPSLDADLLIRAELALANQKPERGDILLKAVEQKSFRWHWLKGQTLYQLGNYAEAASHLALVEPDYPEAVPMLEVCYRELGDFQKAYGYACKQRQ